MSPLNDISCWNPGDVHFLLQCLPNVLRDLYDSHPDDIQKVFENLTAFINPELK